MLRREFITLIGSAAAAWPLAARAQQPKMPVVGFLSVASASEYAHVAAAFRQGLSETGYVEGRNVMIEYLWAEGQNDRMPALATDLVRRQVTVIAAGGNAAARAAKAATATIPIVFQIGGDPVQIGLVASLNRPDGNLTGLTSLSDEVGPRRLEVLHELVPAVSVIAVLVNPTNPTAGNNTRAMQEAARTLGLHLQILHAGTESDFDTAFATLLKLRTGALVITADALFIGASQRLAALALRHAVPTIFQDREFTAAGGLMSYGTTLTNSWRLVGVYVGRILKGEKPADLPVQQATRIELVINLKTAKALGLTVPLALLARADEVIE
jgi:putative tryptophan/tyrosine transport system substrate-binding protein